MFKGTEYGRANLRVQESTGNVSGFFSVQKGAFEPIGMFPATDPIRLASRPIGRIDVLMRLPSGEQATSSCTGALLAGNYVITNHHCLPQSGTSRAVKASIVMDFLQADEAGSERFELELKPEDFSEARDYVVTKVAGNPTAKYGFVQLSATSHADAGQSLMIFHHPMGRPKVLTRALCFAASAQPEKATLRHKCDTMPGSSGSLVLSSRGEPVALHFAGGLNADDPTSYNSAMSMPDLVAASALLQKIIGEQGGPAAAPGTVAAAPAPRIDPSSSSPKKPNDIKVLFSEDDINFMLRSGGAASAASAGSSRPAGPERAVTEDKINDLFRK
jgi:V8-like Glu-specific endopeptidase